VKEVLGDRADVLLLDDAAKKLGIDKYQALAHADLVVQPSAYEGNSYFVLETLACGVPIVAYDVGLLKSISEIAKENGFRACVGVVINRHYRSPEETAKVTSFLLGSVLREHPPHGIYNPRQCAELFSVQNFHQQWQAYLEDYERHLESR
jgi:glycosyltransferase involved in cell wall biosynthesis